MNKAEAGEIARKRIAEVRNLGWQELNARFLDTVETGDVVGASGAVYTVETEVLPDGLRGHIRVVVSVHDGGWWRATFPVWEDVVIAPGGSFAVE